ncbi:hypothetical protein SEPCBS57363_001031 [Sporothrix epigloea]|uniref:Uncharacterized protein n=1 Tax=Sporothrix epigloea TaxID=1892477 RepID=A0ABP0DB80_9PEZI
MSGFPLTFSGEEGEDPAGYLEELNSWATQRLWGMPEEQKEVHKRSAFRVGLRGSARQDWYLKLPRADREWARLQVLFLEQFDVHVLEDDELEVSDQVRAFCREAGEDVLSFLTRADLLVTRCNQYQAEQMRDCIFNRIGESMDDAIIQGFAHTRLWAMNEVNLRGRLQASCTYETVSEATKWAVASLGIKTKRVRGNSRWRDSGYVDEPGLDRGSKDTATHDLNLLIDRMKGHLFGYQAAEKTPRSSGAVSCEYMEPRCQNVCPAATTDCEDNAYDAGLYAHFTFAKPAETHEDCDLDVALPALDGAEDTILESPSIVSGPSRSESASHSVSSTLDPTQAEFGSNNNELLI